MTASKYELRDEVERLRRWKAEATEVILGVAALAHEWEAEDANGDPTGDRTNELRAVLAPAPADGRLQRKPGREDD